MIPRIANHRSQWFDSKAAFAHGDKARPLRIVVDPATVGEGEALTCLQSFSHHPQLEIIVQDGATRLTVGDYDEVHKLMWAEHWLGDGRTRLPVFDNDLDFAAAIEDPDELRQARTSIVAAAVARSADADAVATNSPFLLETPPGRIVQETNPMRPQEAVALAGLYLRLNHDFTIDVQSASAAYFGRHFDYFLLMRELLPAAWRWFSGCGAYKDATGDEEPMMVAQSAMARVMGVLRARDRLHGHLQQPSSRADVEEVLFYLDVALLMLGGALDATAVVAHHVHKLPIKVTTASWSRKDWLKELRGVNAPLADLMKNGTPERDARDMVATLRNTIHSRSLGTISYQGPGTSHQQLVVLPPSVEKALQPIVQRQPDPARFGLEPLPHGQLHLDPGRYLEALFPRVIETLNAIMDATPVEAMQGVNAADLMAGPPDEDTDSNYFRPVVRRRLRLLAGL